ncbi:MAG: hypothetical protein M1816_007807 [Peltula sp. TS41687]|nr:MAG: hypothetical protein M1816_007807 [Peltula sp. TS41687]
MVQETAHHIPPSTPVKANVPHPSSCPRMKTTLHPPKEGFLRIEADTTTDLERCVSIKVSELSSRTEYTPEPCGYVRDRLLDGAGGTFLWVAFVVRAEGQEKVGKRHEKAWQILSWFVMAARPMTVAELSVATEAAPSPGLSHEEILKDQVSFCGDA